MRLMILLAITVVLFPLAASDFCKAGKNDENPVDTFQGEWIVASLSVASYELKGTPQQPMKVSFAKNRMMTRPAIDISFSIGFSIGSDGFQNNSSTTISLAQRDQEATFRIDATKTPAQIDLEEKEGNTVIIRKGIYRITGDGLELCIGSRISSRPKEFKASSLAILFRLKRQAAKN